MIAFHKREIEIGIFQVSIHLFQYRGDLLFPVFGFGNLYAELFSQLIDCQHIKRSLILGGLILDQVNHLGKFQIEIAVTAGQAT